MLHHIVSWKMQGETIQERNKNAAAVATALRNLVGVVPGIAHLEVHINELADPQNWDVVLLSQFATAEDFRAYVIHPAHQEAVAVIKARAAARAAVDYTV